MDYYNYNNYLSRLTNKDVYKRGIYFGRYNLYNNPESIFSEGDEDILIFNLYRKLNKYLTEEKIMDLYKPENNSPFPRKLMLYRSGVGIVSCIEHKKLIHTKLDEDNERNYYIRITYSEYDCIKIFNACPNCISTFINNINNEIKKRRKEYYILLLYLNRYNKGKLYILKDLFKKYLL